MSQPFAQPKYAFWALFGSVALELFGELLRASWMESCQMHCTTERFWLVVLLRPTTHPKACMSGCEACCLVWCKSAAKGAGRGSFMQWWCRPLGQHLLSLCTVVLMSMWPGGWWKAWMVASRTAVPPLSHDGCRIQGHWVLDCWEGCPWRPCHPGATVWTVCLSMQHRQP